MRGPGNESGTSPRTAGGPAEAAGRKNDNERAIHVGSGLAAVGWWACGRGSVHDISYDAGGLDEGDR